MNCYYVNPSKTEALLRDKQWYIDHLEIDYAWEKRLTGRNTSVCVISTSMLKHIDLVYNKELSEGNYDYLAINNYNYDTVAFGTYYGGIIGAKGYKYYIGVAPNTELISLGMPRLLEEIDIIANYMNKNKNKIDIYANLWFLGYSFVYPDINDFEHVIDKIDKIIDMMIQCSKTGRNGKGNIFVFPSFRRNIDNDVIFNQMAYNIFSNIRTSINVAAVSKNMLYVKDSEWGTGILCSSYGLENDNMGLPRIYPKYGYNKVLPYTFKIQAPSGYAASLVTGMIALVLELRPDLSWRDIKELISRSCIVTDLNHFKLNGVNRLISEIYGYGLLNMKLFLKNAYCWNLLPNEQEIISEHTFNNIDLQNNNRGTYEYQINVGKNIIIETVQLYLTINKDLSDEYNIKISDLSIELESPQGTRITLLKPINILYSQYSDYDLINPDARLRQFFNNYPLLSELYRGERTLGTWKLYITDTVPDIDTNPVALLQNIKLNIWGH